MKSLVRAVLMRRTQAQVVVGRQQVEAGQSRLHFLVEELALRVGAFQNLMRQEAELPQKLFAEGESQLR
jgi:hypothetical protein